MTQIPSDDILEGSYKLRIRECEKLKTVLELYKMEIHQKKAGPRYHRLKTMVKRSIEQNLRIQKNGIMKETPWSRIREQQQWARNSRRLLAMESQRAVFKRRQFAVSGTILISVETWHSRIRLRDLSCNRVSEMRREPEVPEESVPVGESFDGHARITSKEICTTPFCERWHPPECLFYKFESGCRFGEKCSCSHRQVKEQPSKRSKKDGDKSAVAMLKSTRQLGCVFQDMEPPKSSSILRRSSNIRTPIRCVQFTEAVVRHANIRDQNPSLGMIWSGDPHQRNANAPKFEDRSQEETEWEERCTCEAAWKLAKNIFKLKEKSSILLTFGKLVACLRHQPLNLRKREFVVRLRSVDAYDQQRGLEYCWNGYFDDVEKSYDGHNSQWRSANAMKRQLCMSKNWIYSWLKILEDTPAVLSLGKFFRWSGINGQKTHLI